MNMPYRNSNQTLEEYFKLHGTLLPKDIENLLDKLQLLKDEAEALKIKAHYLEHELNSTENKFWKMGDL